MLGQLLAWRGSRSYMSMRFGIFISSSALSMRPVRACQCGADSDTRLLKACPGGLSRLNAHQYKYYTEVDDARIRSTTSYS